MIQDCGRQVNDVGKIPLRTWRRGRPRPRHAGTSVPTMIHEQNSRHSIGIDDVISAPTASVVLNERVRKTPQRGLPRDTISRTKTDQQIRSTRGVRSRVEFLAAHYIANCGLSIGWVRNSCEPALNCPTYPLSFRALFQNALALTTLEVQVDSSESDGIGEGARPIHRSKAFT